MVVSVSNDTYEIDGLHLLMDIASGQVVIWVGSRTLRCLLDSGVVANRSFGSVYEYTGHRRWARTQMSTRYIASSCEPVLIEDLTLLWRRRVSAMLFQPDGSPSVRITGEEQVSVRRTD